MKFLANASCDEASAYSGNLLIPDENGKHPHQVFLNVILQEESEYSRLTGKEKSITFKDRVPSFVPTECEGKVFCETTLNKVDNIKVPNGATLLVRLEEDFCNMRQVYDCSKRHPEARFIGGNLLAIPGIKVGRFESKKKPVVYDGVYDDFIEVNLSELDNVHEVVKKVKVKVVDGTEVVSKKKRKGEKKPKKEKKPNKRLASFNSLFGGEAVEF